MFKEHSLDRDELGFSGVYYGVNGNSIIATFTGNSFVYALTRYSFDLLVNLESSADKYDQYYGHFSFNSNQLYPSRLGWLHIKATSLLPHRRQTFDCEPNLCANYEQQQGVAKWWHYSTVTDAMGYEQLRMDRERTTTTRITTIWARTWWRERSVAGIMVSTLNIYLPACPRTITTLFAHPRRMKNVVDLATVLG